MKSLHALAVLLFLVVPFLPQGVFAQNDAIFILSPDSGTYNRGDKFSVDLKFNSSEPITSVKSYLEFDNSIIRVESIDSSAGIFSYWWENSFNNKTGKIQLQASLPSPGEKEGVIARINFKAVKDGQAGVTFEASSLVLKPSDENILNLAASAGAQFSLFSPSLSEKVGTTTSAFVLAAVLAVLVIFFIFVRKKRLFRKA